ncbi:MAG TPA: WD40 repeat domain-containing protein, partial [Ktedonobacteraceae bacterium]|nr:WD40 repeat domain-containing protein [Ktedonobacteraceae bacterium]
GLGLSLGAAATYLTIKAVTSHGGPPTSPTPTPRPPAAGPSPEVQRGGTVYRLQHDGRIYRVAWSPDGKYLATSTWEPNQTVCVWDKEKPEKPLASFTGHTATVTDVTWSPDGSRIASSGGIGDNTVWIWDPLRGNATSPGSMFKIPLPPDMNSARAVAWSPDGKQLAIGGGRGGHDFNIHLYDSAGNPGPILSGHKETINSLAWRPPQVGDNDQYLASASDDFTVWIWKPRTGESWSLVGHKDSVYAVAWSPDGQYLATGAAGSKDHTVQVWKWKEEDKTSIYTHDSHTDTVYAVTWSPDSAYIASASADKTVHVYDAVGDGGFYSYPAHRGIVHAAAWQPQASLVASGGDDKDMDTHYYVRVWQALDT